MGLHISTQPYPGRRKIMLETVKFLLPHVSENYIPHKWPSLQNCSYPPPNHNYVLLRTLLYFGYCHLVYRLWGPWFTVPGLTGGDASSHMCWAVESEPQDPRCLGSIWQQVGYLRPWVPFLGLWPPSSTHRLSSCFLTALPLLVPPPGLLDASLGKPYFVTYQSDAEVLMGVIEAWFPRWRS